MTCLLFIFYLLNLDGLGLQSSHLTPALIPSYCRQGGWCGLLVNLVTKMHICEARGVEIIVAGCLID